MEMLFNPAASLLETTTSPSRASESHPYPPTQTRAIKTTTLTDYLPFMARRSDDPYALSCLDVVRLSCAAMNTATDFEKR